jgi:hypothetical protein
VSNDLAFNSHHSRNRIHPPFFFLHRQRHKATTTLSGTFIFSSHNLDTNTKMNNNSVERDDFLSPAAPSYAEATTYSDTYDNPFETNIPQRLNSPSIEPDDVPLPGQKPLSPVKSPLPKVSGNMGSSSNAAGSSSQGSGSNQLGGGSNGVGLGVGQAMMGSAIDTLDEPVSETLVSPPV